MNTLVVRLIPAIGFPLCAAVCWADPLLFPSNLAPDLAWSGPIAVGCGLAIGAKCDNPNQHTSAERGRAPEASTWKATTSNDLPRPYLGLDHAASGNPVLAPIDWTYVYMGHAGEDPTPVDEPAPLKPASDLTQAAARSVRRTPAAPRPGPSLLPRPAVRTAIGSPDPLHNVDHFGAPMRALIIRAIERAYAEHPEDFVLISPLLNGPNAMCGRP